MAREKTKAKILEGAGHLLDVDPASQTQWRDRPFGDVRSGEKGVNENLLPPAKAQFELFGRYVERDTIKQATTLAPQCVEPSASNYVTFLEEVAAIGRTGKRVLSLQFFAGHGLCISGMQAVACN